MAVNFIGLPRTDRSWSARARTLEMSSIFTRSCIRNKMPANYAKLHSQQFVDLVLLGDLRHELPHLQVYASGIRNRSAVCACTAAEIPSCLALSGLIHHP